MRIIHQKMVMVIQENFEKEYVMKHFIMLMLILGLSACGSVPKVPEQPKALVKYDPPKWVMQGGGAYNDNSGKAFYGVG